MRQFKKRTLALVLASAVTVVGSFASENYKNSLMSLNFEMSTNGSLNMVLETKTAYTGNITPIKRDANTYILMLPEVNSNAPTPDLKNSPGNIESVSIRTMPYSASGKGYTKITVKTQAPITLLSTNKIYLPTQNDSANQIEKKETSIQTDKISQTLENNNTKEHYDEFTDLKNNNYTSEKQQNSSPKEHTLKQDSAQENYTEGDYSEYQNNYRNSSTEEATTLLMGILLILTCIIFFYVKARNKLTEIAGEHLEIDLEDDVPDTKKQKNKHLNIIKNTIKTLDSSYAKTAVRGNYKESLKQMPARKLDENINIVDLDKIYEEQSKNNIDSDDENRALEEFLSGFSFYEEEPVQESSFNEEDYKKILNNKSIKFTKTDIECINYLLNSEISNETLKNVDKYLISNPVKKKPSQKEILENLITDYAISQNIIFSSEDVDIIKKIMSVELDPDFVTDLRTNSKHTCPDELKHSSEKIIKKTEIVTLNVKDILPNISEELKKQKGKKIESNHKPETVYFQEGYDVSKLSITDTLPDLSKEINNKQAYIPKPTAEIQLVDTNYEVSTLKIADSLPSIKDLKKEENKKPKEKFKVNEKDLLNSIKNVEIKPFSEGQEYEIINDLSNIKEQKDKTQEIENLKNNSKKSKNTEILLNRITRKQEQKEKAEKNSLNNSAKKQNTINTEKNTSKFIVENESYTVISSTYFTDNMGCHLAQNENGFAILTFVGDKVSKIKTYDKLNNKKIQSRLSETLPDKTQRYIIRIGSNKIIVDVNDNSIKYVMDLC